MSQKQRTEREKGAKQRTEAGQIKHESRNRDVGSIA
jgi:hypothetical protein